jgi:hypothetical protein
MLPSQPMPTCPDTTIEPASLSTVMRGRMLRVTIALTIHRIGHWSIGGHSSHAGSGT